MFVLPLRYVRRRGSDMHPGGSAGTRCMVPVERIELPTFGLQNHCSTAELNRRMEVIGGGYTSLDSAGVSAARIPDLPVKGQNPAALRPDEGMEKSGLVSRPLTNRRCLGQ